MNDGAPDDPIDYGEVPGHRPTVILSHPDGDETMLPRAVEQRLRRAREDSWMQARAECDMPAIGFGRWQRDGSLNGAWQPEPPPPRVTDEDESVDESPAVMAPIYASFGVAVCVQVLITVLLVALHVGGALDWAWGWVLAPLWVPSTVATVAVTLVGIVLAALDERDAARRRNLLTRGN